MQADTTELAELAIELEAFFVILYLTDADELALFVPYLVTLDEAAGERVECWLLGAPELGIVDHEDVGGHF